MEKIITNLFLVYIIIGIISLILLFQIEIKFNKMINNEQYSLCKEKTNDIEWCVKSFSPSFE